MFMITNRRIILNIKYNKYEPKYTILDTKDGVQEDWFLSDIPKNVDIFGLVMNSSEEDIIIPYNSGIVVLGKKPRSTLYTVAIFTDNTSVKLKDIDENALRYIISSSCFKIYGFKYDYYKYCNSLILKLSNALNEFEFNYKPDVQIKYATMSKTDRAKYKLLRGTDNNLYTVSSYKIDMSGIEVCYMKHDSNKHRLMDCSIVQDIDEYDIDGKYKVTYRYVDDIDFSLGSNIILDYDDNKLYDMSEIQTITVVGFLRYRDSYINNIISTSGLDGILCSHQHNSRLGFTIKDSFYFDGIQKFTGL